jgi:DNA-binding transcriptional regulator YdaS (Cro superfamily)
MIAAMDILRQHIKAKHGRTKALAEAVGVKPSTISQWHQVPAERVLAVEAHTGISRYKLRPDIYGPAPTKRGRAA